MCSGAVGKPFPTVEVCVAKPNVYNKNGYDVIALGNAQRTTVKDGTYMDSDVNFLCLCILLFKSLFKRKVNVSGFEPGSACLPAKRLNDHSSKPVRPMTPELRLSLP